MAKLAGVHLELTSEHIGQIPNKRFVNKNMGSIEGTTAWRVQPEDGRQRCQH
jgi:hypothetical protein